MREPKPTSLVKLALMMYLPPLWLKLLAMKPREIVAICFAAVN